MVFTYACFDPLDEVLRPGYFRALDRIRVGDLIYLGISPRPAKAVWQTRHQGHETRRALLMVRGRGEDGQVRVRLVLDYGRPDDPDAEIAHSKRGRGRPAKTGAE